MLNIKIALMFSLIVTVAFKVSALPDDSKQRINIQADSASQVSAEQGEKTEYFGDVQITQGSLKINGEHVVILSEIREQKRQITSIVATGNPAMFEQQSSIDKAPVKAQANKLDYRLNSDTVILSVDACIEQDAATVSGERIEYNIAAEQIKASSGNDASSRVNMVLLPEGEVVRSCNPGANKVE